MDERQDPPANCHSVAHMAELLLRQHGRWAVRIAANRAIRLGEAGDRLGALEWLEISKSLREMQKGNPPR